MVEERLTRLCLEDLDALWRRAIAAALAEDTVWLHGDLHPRNVVVRDGTLAGIIDWGDMTAGDVATDLACAWMLFDSRGRSALLDAYGATEAERLRAMGWAVNFASALIESGEPRHTRMGHFTLHQLVGSV